jgi:hypothetical protein
MEFRRCLEAAGHWLQDFSKEAGALGLPVLFGLDVYVGCVRDPGAREPGAQLLAHFDPKAGFAELVASKRLPTSQENGTLYLGRPPEGLPKILKLEGLGPLLPLVCHDMNVLNPRGLAAQSKGGAQESRRTSIIADLNRPEVTVAFAAIHSLWPSATTFRTSMRALEARYHGQDGKKRIGTIAAFGTYEDSLGQVLKIAERHTSDGWCVAELIPKDWPEA